MKRELDETALTKIAIEVALKGYSIALFPNVDVTDGFIIAHPKLIDELEEFLGMELERHSVEEDVYRGVKH
jgi:hypothetical protein